MDDVVDEFVERPNYVEIAAEVEAYAAIVLRNFISEAHEEIESMFEVAVSSLRHISSMIRLQPAIEENYADSIIQDFQELIDELSNYDGDTSKLEEFKAKLEPRVKYLESQRGDKPRYQLPGINYDRDR